MSESNENVKRLVQKTVDKYSLTTFSASELKGVICACGFTVIRYYTKDSSPETERLMELLDVSRYAELLDSFTYSRGERRIVFVSGDIADRNLPYFLALEIGNILMSEPSEDGVLGQTPAERIAANEFAHHITDFTRHGLLYNFFKYRIGSTITSVIAVFVSVICLGFTFISVPVATISEDFSQGISENQEEISFIPVANALNVHFVTEKTEELQVKDVFAESDTDYSADNITFEEAANGSQTAEKAPDVSITSSDEFVIPEDERFYYSTKSGKKYHIEGCSYIKDRETVKLTASDVENKGYEPCSRCFK